MAYRPCAVCGAFYPSESVELKREIKRLLEQTVPGSTRPRIRGLVLPHAGYIYSGVTSAHGLAQLQGQQFDVVVIVAPSHREYFDGVSVYPGDGYRTPLGSVPVDKKLRKKLLESSPCVRLSYEGHGAEHAVEVQLPFLQSVLPSFSFLPVVIGDQKRSYCMELGNALGLLLKGTNALLIASTDLSHYHPAKIAEGFDAVMIDDIGRFDPEQLMGDLETGKTEACGGGPTVAVMTALNCLGVDKMEVLHHSNSGDVTGDYDKVVGYLSAVAYA